MTDTRKNEFDPMDLESGGPAFPMLVTRALSDGKGGLSYVTTHKGGMTLREWFAGHALSALIAQQNDATACADKIAWEAFALADAMIRQRGDA